MVHAPPEVPPEATLDTQLHGLLSDFHQLEIAIEDELFLIDEVDLFVEEVLERAAPGQIVRGERRLQAEEQQRRARLAREESTLVGLEAELAGILRGFPDGRLDWELASATRRTRELCTQAESLSPGISWEHLGDAALLTATGPALEQALQQTVARTAFLCQSIEAERKSGYAADRLAVHSFLARAWPELLRSASPAQRQRMASRAQQTALAHLAEGAATDGVWRQAQLAVAERRLDSVVANYPGFSARAVVLDALATTRLVLNRPRAAEEACWLLVREERKSPLRTTAASRILQIRFDGADYESVLEAAQELEPILPRDDAAYYVGISALALGDAHTARIALESVPESSAFGRPATLSLAAALAATGETDLARSMLADLSLRRVRGRDEESVRDRATLALGLLFYEAGLFEDSWEILNEIPTESPVKGDAILAAARCRVGAREEREARELLQGLARENPGTIYALRALMALAELDVREGDLDRAEATLDHAVVEIRGNRELAALCRLEESEAALRAEAERIEELRSGVLAARNAAAQRGDLVLADALASTLPELREMSLEAQQLVAAPRHSVSVEVPLLLRAAEMRLAEIGLARVGQAQEELRTLTRGPTPPLQVASSGSRVQDGSPEGEME
jgi:predicted negative regulator of RcsB-dependent stress response